MLPKILKIVLSLVAIALILYIALYFHVSSSYVADVYACRTEKECRESEAWTARVKYDTREVGYYIIQLYSDSEEFTLKNCLVKAATKNFATCEDENGNLWNITLLETRAVWGLEHLFWKKHKNSIPDPSGQPYNSLSSIPTNTVTRTSIDEKWDLYTSPALGISVRVPKKALGAVSCKVQNGKVIFAPGMISVNVFEDSNTLYVGPEYFYEESGYFASEIECVKTVFDPITTLKELSPASSFIPYLGLQISVHSEIKTANEINKFIKERIDSTCRMEERRPYLDFENVDYILLDDNPLVLSRFACPTHIQPYQFLYNRESGKIIWSSGEAEKLKDEFGNDISSDISSSAEFLP